MNRRSALRFVVTAGLASIALFGLLRVGWVEQNLLIPFTGAQWSLACLLGANADAPVTVGLSCSAADVIALCLGFVLAFPVTWHRRLVGAAIGLVVIAAVNTLRIATLSWVVTDRPLFNLLHIYLWPAVLLVVVSIYVFFWMSRSLKADEDESQVGSARVADEKRRGLSAGWRFAMLTLLFVGLFIGTSVWWMKSALVLTVAQWVAATGAAVIRLFGGEATLINNYLKTSNGGFMVTQECIMTPLIPAYFAAVLASTWERSTKMTALLAAFPLFFLLGAARLLVLAFPADLVGSPLTAVHGFHQLVLGLFLIGFATYRWRGVEENRDEIVRRGALALALAIAIGTLVALSWSPLVFAAREFMSRYLEHVGHALADPQRALYWLSPFQAALFAGLWWARHDRSPWQRSLIGFAILLLSMPAVLLAVGELSHHLGRQIHVALVRGWAVAAPLALILLLERSSSWRDESRVLSLAETRSG